MLTLPLKSLCFSVLTGVATAMFSYSTAWAYKVEKICEDVPATSTVPAHKKCKVVRKTEKAPAKGDGKSDGKTDGKGDAKADAKK